MSDALRFCRTRRVRRVREVRAVTVPGRLGRRLLGKVLVPPSALPSRPCRFPSRRRLQAVRIKRAEIAPQTGLDLGTVGTPTAASRHHGGERQRSEQEDPASPHTESLDALGGEVRLEIRPRNGRRQDARSGTVLALSDMPETGRPARPYFAAPLPGPPPMRTGRRCTHTRIERRGVRCACNDTSFAGS